MTNTSISESYVRKPLYVEAVQVTAENFEEAAKWCSGKIQNLDDSPVDPDAPVDPSKQYIRVRVVSPKNPRQTQAKVGDWILYADMGYKVYTPRAFDFNFEKVDLSRPHAGETRTEDNETEGV